MARSYEYYKEEVKEYLKREYEKEDKVLDVGAGCGTYYNLLGDYFENMEAVEVFAPNVERYNLRSKYRKVYVCDIKDFEYEYYDLIIFGDILEHLEVSEAREVLEYAEKRCKGVLVALPYMYPQGIEEENIYEIHKQEDLTKENVLERYPMLKLLYGNELYGYYVFKE